MKAWTVCLLIALTAPLQALELPEAERLALSADPELTALAERARAFGFDATAAGQLPDPQLTLGTMSVPLPSFDVRDEPMTQFQVGVNQRFPARALRQARSNLGTARSSRLQANMRLRALEVKRQLRQRWVSGYYLQQLLLTDQQALDWLRQMTESRVRGLESARIAQSAVLTSRSLEARLARQLTAKRNDLYQIRAQLGETLQVASLPAEWSLNSLLIPQNFEPNLHPAAELAGMMVEEAQAGIEVASAAFKPGWTIQAGIGQRIGDEPMGAPSDTLINAQLTIDLPIFTRNRQSKDLSAARARHAAAGSETVGVLRRLRADISSAQAQLSEFDALIEIYADQVLPSSRAAAEALRDRYQSGRASLEDVIAAELELTDIQREWLQTKFERDLVVVELQYLGGQ